MTWVAFALGAVLAWGMYGPALHKGQVLLGSPLRALLCVGFAYFLLGVLVPVASLATSPGGIGSFHASGRRSPLPGCTSASAFFPSIASAAMSPADGIHSPRHC